MSNRQSFCSLNVYCRSHESTSQMSVLNVYQAVRSLLHFSQLTAWYMSTNGTKPANVIYRVVAPDDATYIADDDFVSHNLPLVDVNKTVSMKVRFSFKLLLK